MSEITWEAVSKSALTALAERGLGEVYAARLNFELSEVEKQGAESVWVSRVIDKKRFASNPNNLVLPWLLGLVEGDPIAARSTPMLNTVRASKVLDFKDQNGYVPHDFVKDPDSPDIDIDCLPAARDPLKNYAIKQYGGNYNDGYGAVCSVGTWQTYKFKSALIDASVALAYMGRGTTKGNSKKKSHNNEPVANEPKAESFTKLLPDDVDELRENGVSSCKAINPATGKECGTVYGGPVLIDRDGMQVLDTDGLQSSLKCPVCGGEDTDNPTFAKVWFEYEPLRQLYDACQRKRIKLQYDYNELRSAKLLAGEEPPEERQYPDLFSIAVNLIGRIRNMGMHAGAIIITNRPLYGNVPMAKTGRKGFWTSMWTEGRSPQLSKFGYIKWDLLGLKTLEYIFRCCQLIQENRGISFGNNMEGMEYNNPLLRHAGYYFDGDGTKHYINMDDTHALRLANQQKTDGVFQFDTDLAKSILANQSYCFEDLMLFNAMGHPGPMQSIPEAVKNRDDLRGTWKKKLAAMHPILLEVLGDTYGVLVYQEQLAAIWQRLASFTSPEAQEARKAVAKKHTHKLKPIGEKWLIGASKTIGLENAKLLWDKQVTFGRYAFNRSHAVSYCLVAFKCLWLKAHFAPEFWAAVMSDCHPDKLVRYMGVARAEEWSPTDITYCGKYKGTGTKPTSVKFSVVNIENMTVDFTVTGDTVNQGLIGIKGLGEKASMSFEGRGVYGDIDEFVASAPGRQSKTVLERFIKLGAFKHLPGHENALALWEWYQYKYCKSGKNMTEKRREIRQRLLDLEGWNPQTIQQERDRQIAEWKRAFPRRNKIPTKFKNWQPKPNDARDKVMSLFADDFSVTDRLAFQQSFLGYWIDSPLDPYRCEGITIAQAKENGKGGSEVKLEGLITKTELAETKKGNPYLRVHLTDGVQTALIFVWETEIKVAERRQSLQVIAEDSAVQLFAQYDEKRGTFALARGEVMIPLLLK